MDDLVYINNQKLVQSSMQNATFTDPKALIAAEQNRLSKVLCSI